MNLRLNAVITLALIGMLGISNCAMGELTWEYDADDNVFPNDPNQPFEGGVQNEPTFKTLVDLGGGDIVLQFDTQSTDANVGSVYEQYPGTNPAHGQWSVSPTVGYSLEWRVKLDGTLATQLGSADLSWADGYTNTRLRLIRGAEQAHWIARIQDSGNLDVDEVVLSAETIPGFDPNDFHSFQINVQNSLIDLYVDGLLVINDATDTIPNGQNRIQVGDVTGGNDGKWQMQFLRTYQDGPLAAPTLAGDVDGDGDVDGEDFLLIQQGYGTTYDADDLADWEGNYGKYPLGLSAALTDLSPIGAVPEPSTALLSLSLLLVVGRNTSRRQR